jgi:hypothetical protein
MTQARIYEAGRPTTGYCRGEKIADPGEVQIGDTLIGLSHQFRTENLYRVTGHKGDRFSVAYINPNGQKADGGEMCVWGFNLTGPGEEWLQAVATQKDTT